MALVVLIGPSSAGKTTFAKKHFKPSEILSSDYCRYLVADDENALDANDDTFELLHFMAQKRLQRGLLTVVDATNVRSQDRGQLLRLAKEHHVLPIALVINPGEKSMLERNAARPERNLPERVIRRQFREMKSSLRNIKREGFHLVLFLEDHEDINGLTIERIPLRNDKKELTGPFDIIGDVHGCYEELLLLLAKLGYTVSPIHDKQNLFREKVTPPPGRMAIFLGDLVDRGPDSPAVLRLVMSMIKAGIALCVCGNHDAKLLKELAGKQVQVSHGLAETLQQLEREPPEFIQEVKQFLEGLLSHYVLDGGKLVVAHAGLCEAMQGRASAAVRSFCLYGDTTGETDEFGLPVRYPWAEDYRGKAMVVYGHTPVPVPEWLNHTICIDSGCVFGGKLTAFRYPERDLVDVPALQQYAIPQKPLAPKDATSVLSNGVVDSQNLLGKLVIETRLAGHVTILEGQSAASLEIMSRFAADPRQVIYLPPTMSPVQTTTLPGFLEHPAEGFDYYRKQGVETVICEEKHMGSRAIIVIGKSVAALQKRFAIKVKYPGWVLTRSGRPFFADTSLEQQLVQSMKSTLDEAEFWKTHSTTWVLIDAELMPWSAKAQKLLEDQYAAVATAGDIALEAALHSINLTNHRGVEIGNHQDRIRQRLLNIQQFRKSYRQYCWPTHDTQGLKIAPFHILATENQAHVDKNHLWHMEHIQPLVSINPHLFCATDYRVLSLSEPAALEATTQWWLEKTERGGEGMVMKPFDFITSGPKGIVQPALKVRGKEYLRIIYGPDYDLEPNLENLRRRRLGKKRSLAISEFALGVEALELFVHRHSLSRVHQCVFGVLALESEAVDPAL